MLSQKELVIRAELAHNMKMLRLTLGITQGELSELSDVCRQSISEWESMLALPSVASMTKWLSGICKGIELLWKGGKKVKFYDLTQQNAVSLPSGEKVPITSVDLRFAVFKRIS